MGKSTDKTMRQITHRKSKAEIIDMFNPDNLDVDVEMYSKATNQKKLRANRKSTIRLKENKP